MENPHNLPSHLVGMTQEKWDNLTASEKDRLRDESGLSPQLIGLEGWRVAVRDEGATGYRKFIVGRSTGWRPCHLEIRNRRNLGGQPARKSYASICRLERVR